MSPTYIPAGRTSLVKQGGNSLQIQTEYAGNPAPRITTTILQAGVVLHKVQRGLDQPIKSIEERNKIEQSIVRQHVEVISILKEGKKAETASKEKTLPKEERPTGIVEKLKGISGVTNVFRLDNEGNFVGAQTSEQFKTLFSGLFKNVHDLLSVFSRVPGVGFTREAGVYEIESDRLYLISMGIECYFVVVTPESRVISYENEIRQAVLDEF